MPKYRNMKDKQVAMRSFFADDAHSLNLTAKWIDDTDTESDTTIRFGSDVEYFTQRVVRGKTASYAMVRVDNASNKVLECSISPAQYRRFHRWASPLPTQQYLPALFPIIDL